MNEWKKKMARPSPESAGPVTDESVKRQLAVAAGTENFQNRDPLFHLTESFRTTFDMMGQQRARGESPDLEGALASYMKDEVPGIIRQGPGLFGFEGGGEQNYSGGPVGGQMAGEFLSKTSMDPYYKTREQRPGNRLMNRFSEVTFNRGVMSGAVLQGQGKMMLFSCLKRTAGQESPMYLRERALFQAQSMHRHVPSSRGDVSIVNRGFVDSAVGLVVDVLKDSRQVVESMTKMAEGGGMPDGASGVGTMHKMYPFLTDSHEKGMLEEYRARLARPDISPQERDVLQRAVTKTEAVIAKKDQMKRDFIQKLRYISYSAASAAAVFSQEEFRQELTARLMEEEPELPPPDDGGADDGQNGGGTPDGAPDASKGGNEQTE